MGQIATLKVQLSASNNFWCLLNYSKLLLFISQLTYLYCSVSQGQWWCQMTLTPQSIYRKDYTENISHCRCLAAVPLFLVMSELCLFFNLWQFLQKLLHFHLPMLFLYLKFSDNTNWHTHHKTYTVDVIYFAARNNSTNTPNHLLCSDNNSTSVDSTHQDLQSLFWSNQLSWLLRKLWPFKVR